MDIEKDTNEVLDRQKQIWNSRYGSDLKLGKEQSVKIFSLTTKKTCVMCNAGLQGINIDYYPHPEGWKLENTKGRFWLYIVCKKCGYQNALWKLGYPQN